MQPVPRDVGYVPAASLGKLAPGASLEMVPGTPGLGGHIEFTSIWLTFLSPQLAVSSLKAEPGEAILSPSILTILPGPFLRVL
jgi:hypothetical protein